MLRRLGLGIPLLLTALLVAGAYLTAAEAERPAAIVADIDAEIHPVAAEFVERVVTEAADTHAPLVVLRISTPGGRLDSTREITRTILGSDVPVVGFVTPPGAQAASAGFLVLMACDVAAMAPGTNAGAASPVGGGGEDLPKTIGKKVSEDAAALLRSLVVPRGRPADDAVKTVTEALSYSDSEALEKKLIEVVARDLPDLMKQLHGRTVKRVGKPDAVLATEGLRLVEVKMTRLERVLAVIASPTVAGILFLIGAVGLYSELQNPGAIFPGVLGSICLLMAFFAMSVLPTSWVGIGLILLGILFFFLEVKLTGHGLFAIGGGISIILGAVLLFPRDEFAPRGELWFLVSAAATVSVVLALLSLKALSVQRLPGRFGAEDLVGRGAAVRMTPSGPKVFVDGALWDARSATPLEEGESVLVVGLDGLTMIVKPNQRSEKP